MFDKLYVCVVKMTMVRLSLIDFQLYQKQKKLDFSEININKLTD